MRDRLWTIAHLSRVEAFLLVDGRRVVLKARAFEPRLRACSEVHRQLWLRGYPCAEPLGELVVRDGVAISFEALVDDGATVDSGPPDSTASAAALARLTELAASTGTGPAELAPPVPWVRWDHDQDGLWPRPDDLPLDLNGIDGPELVDTAARRLRARLRRYPAPVAVVGHGDWEAQNVFWRGGALHAVHDWDSVVGRPEPFVVGPAAAVHAVRGRPSGRPHPRHMVEFLDGYLTARGLSWGPDDRQASLASGLWVHFFNAKKAAAAGDRSVADDPYLRALYALIETVGG